VTATVRFLPTRTAENMRAIWLTAQSYMGQYPRVFLPYARRRFGLDYDGMPLVIGAGTEAVIEGYPRSGNTFAVAAFRLAQKRPVQLAHHVHAPAQILEGLRLGLPVTVLIRRPEDAVLSYVIRAPMDVERALHMYIRFYARVLPRRGDVVIAPFSTVITDFDSIIVSMNKRFGTSFGGFLHAKENVRLAFESIEARGHRDAARQRRDYESGVARPSATRESLKAELRARYASDASRDLRSKADRLYRLFVGDDE
jgi:hypothetical protein